MCPLRLKPSPQQSQQARPPGVALLSVLLAVLLLTVFVSESFFDMGLELRALRTQQAAEQARFAARSGLKAITQALQLDEVSFFTELDRLKRLSQTGQLHLGSIQFKQLDVQPLDHLYNLNELSNLQPDSDRDRIRWDLFLQTLQDIPLPPVFPGGEPQTVSEEIAAQIYAAIVDWTDNDNNEYNGASGFFGAEDSTYAFAQPSVQVKNTLLDDIHEARMLRGMAESNIPWGGWINHFIALPRFGNQSWFLPERINVNTASREDIVSHLKRRELRVSLASSNNRLNRDGIRSYSERAEDIAETLIPTGRNRPTYTSESLTKTLNDLGFRDNFGTNFLFSTTNTYYGVRIVTESDGVAAEVAAIVHVPRDQETRTSLQTEVISLRFR